MFRLLCQQLTDQHNQKPLNCGVELNYYSNLTAIVGAGEMQFCFFGDQQA
jgi:hypothetical protein